MATAKKLPSGNYRVRVYDKATEKYKSFTAPTKREAERLASDYLAGLALSGMKTVQQRIYPIIKKNRLGIRFESSKKRKMRLSCFGGIIQCSMTFLWVWSLQIWEYIGY